jgi:hypothetical protein
MKDKRGQDISITTIILVVLGIAVLVLLILGFTKGWSNIAPWLSGNNVDTITTQCQASCATSGKFDFCNAPKNLNAGTDKLTGVTCYYLAKKLPSYGIAECSTITCDVLLDTACGTADTGKVSQTYNTATKTLTIATCP